ncbi:hypothetical protein LUZ60_011218 [Juncus effusus]|nr:hypothetical protein LUZ60_011218 [Juncus effusus]
MATAEMTTQTTEYSGKTAPESGYPNTNGPPVNYFRVDALLRLLLLASAVSALVVLVTSKETKVIAILPAPLGMVKRDAKFNYSPALIYLLVALSTTCLYSIITVISSCALMSKLAPSPKILFHLILLDVLMAAIMASATGAAGGIAYTGLKGNSHTNWGKICNVYGKFCRYTGSSIALSLFGSIILVLLVLISAFSLYRRSHH